MKTESIPSDFRTKTRISTLIQHTFECSVGSPTHGNERRKEVKETQNAKDVKQSLFGGDMILYREDTKDATRKLLELINEFAKL